MINKSAICVAFLIGIAAGSIVTWHGVKKKYETLAQEEIDSVKEVFSKRRNNDDISETTLSGEDVTSDKVSLIETYTDILETNGYTNYAKNTDERSESVVKAKIPYVISPEQFGMNDDYAQISLTYYADQVLTDEDDEIIEDIEGTIGIDSLNHFGEYEDDSVFVRNEELKCDYEILLDERLYSDVAAY